MTKNDIDINQIIAQQYPEGRNSPFAWKYSKSTMFLLPMLGIDLRNRLLAKYLRNVYIDDKSRAHDYTRPLFLLFAVKSFKEKDWAQLLDLLETRDSLKGLMIDDYYVSRDVEDGVHLIMYVYKTPDKWANDYYHFKAGRYSKFSKEYKSKFPTEASENGKIVENNIYGIIHKTDNIIDKVASYFARTEKDKEELIRDMRTWDEVWEAPVKEYEYFNCFEQKLTT